MELVVCFPLTSWTDRFSSPYFWKLLYQVIRNFLMNSTLRLDEKRLSSVGCFPIFRLNLKKADCCLRPTNSSLSLAALADWKTFCSCFWKLHRKCYSLQFFLVIYLAFFRDPFPNLWPILLATKNADFFVPWKKCFMPPRRHDGFFSFPQCLVSCPKQSLKLNSEISTAF